MATSTIAIDTELSAVNSILSAIGQSSITTLNFNNPETQFIYTLLEETIKDVLNEGWHFNTEDHVEVSPDASGYITIPTSYLRYDLNGAEDKSMDLVRRNGRLYDKVNHTDVFTDKVYLDIVYLYTFTDIPSVFQRYIIAKASTRAAAQMVTNPNLVQLLQTQEALTRASVIEYECNQGDHSMMGFPHESTYNSYKPYKALNR
tara:strand:- start:843 stop:1451 length:609 start_codon:yes stop_codon:yes gene_type:complete